MKSSLWNSLSTEEMEDLYGTENCREKTRRLKGRKELGTMPAGKQTKLLRLEGPIQGSAQSIHGIRGRCACHLEKPVLSRQNNTVYDSLMDFRLHRLDLFWRLDSKLNEFPYLHSAPFEMYHGRTSVQKLHRGVDTPNRRIIAL